MSGELRVRCIEIETRRTRTKETIQPDDSELKARSTTAKIGGAVYLYDGSTVKSQLKRIVTRQ